MRGWYRRAKFAQVKWLFTVPSGGTTLANVRVAFHGKSTLRRWSGKLPTFRKWISLDWLGIFRERFAAAETIERKYRWMNGRTIFNSQILFRSNLLKPRFTSPSFLLLSYPTGFKTFLTKTENPRFSSKRDPRSLKNSWKGCPSVCLNFFHARYFEKSIQAGWLATIPRYFTRRLRGELSLENEWSFSYARWQT